jgi:hypothetical protein
MNQPFTREDVQKLFSRRAPFLSQMDTRKSPADVKFYRRADLRRPLLHLLPFCAATTVNKFN